ncbi:MAG: Asp-tRNA(Asn)/Glu-tRNA(Gln) amidotransferase subunit GatC [Planctomycetota bacterium]|nr:MAG: Asp-tRNA(Asn)/Glu-tRNA(Gln) amidotransferase subunit GatC [Planctomycetota bacterium]
MDESIVRHISLLARLNPSDEEIRLFSEQLSSILEYIDLLNEVDTTDVPPTAHALEVHNVFRVDQPGKSLKPDQALANAPQRDGNFFAVPKVLDQDSGA